MSNKISLTLYNISMGQRILNTDIDIENITDINDFNFDSMTEGYRYSPDTFDGLNDKITVKLFYSSGEETKISQNDFLNEISSDIPLLENKRASFILFIFYKGERYSEENNILNTDKKLYAICGGSGWSEISGYINHQFGYDIISRILPSDAKDKEIIRYLENKNIIGNIDYQSRSFRRLYSIGYENSYWSIYTDMVLAFDEGLLEQIGITELSATNISNNVGVAVTSGLYIKKKISFSQLQEVIEKISLLYYENPNFSFNKLEIIKTKDAKESCKNQVIESIRKELLLKKNYGDFSIGILDSNSYSDSLKIQYKNLEHTIEDNSENFSKNILMKVVEIYDDQQIADIDIELFLHSLKLKGEFKNYGNILKLLELEFKCLGNTHFYFLGNFYKVKKQLESNIKKDFKVMYEGGVFLEGHDLLNKNWEEGEHEDFYNNKYIEEEKYYVFDKITPEGVEFCDIMHVSEDSVVSIFHIKDGFGQSIRDLVFQVENSTRFVQEQVWSGERDGYFNEVYKWKIRQNNTDGFNEKFDTIDKFLELFKDTGKINIYLGIKYRKQRGDYTKCKSIVPKVALLDLQKKVNSDLKIKNFKIIKI